MTRKWLLLCVAVISLSYLFACTSQNDSLAGGSSGGGGGGGTGGGTPSAAPTNLAAVASSSNQIDLTWTDNATDETEYQVERKTSSTSFSQVTSLGPDLASWSDTGLSPSISYTYRVRAVTPAGNTKYSNQALATTQPPPATPPVAPSGLSATPASDTEISLTWTDNANNETGFLLERKTGAGGTYAQVATPSANAVSYTNGGLTLSTTYYFRIRATNASGNSAYSNETSATTLAAPPPSSYVVLAYNDTGMNVTLPTFDTFMLAPPSNTLRAQVIKRGALPQIVTAGVSIAYSIPGNTHSSDKVNFWTNAVKLIGRSLTADTGVTGNKLTGTMVYAGGGYWNATGIPVTPKMDNGTMNPYPLATVTVKTTSNNVVVATTQTPVATSWEMRCASCHTLPSVLTSHGLDGKGGNNVNMTGDCKICHPNGTGSNVGSKFPAPIFCVRCHTSYPQRSIYPGYNAYPPLSRAIHRSHSSRTSDCFSCHPGQTDKYLRDVHYSAGLTCTSCHGSMTTLAGSTRRPWQDEPKCTQCHNVAGHKYEQAGVLYKDSLGHHGVACASCHGAPHAIGPSSVAADNAQAIAQQGAAGVISDCTVCHDPVPASPFNHTY